MLFKNVGAAARGQPRAHAQPADRHADRADLGLGGDDRLPGVLQLPRPLHLLRHGPAGAVGREADRPRHAPLHRVLPLRQPVPVRDLDPAQGRTPATSRTSPSRASTTWARCSSQVLNKLELALDSPAYNYIIHTAPFDHAGAAALPLAHRDHPPADEGRRLRVGLGLLHQPRPPRGRRRLPPRRRGHRRAELPAGTPFHGRASGRATLGRDDPDLTRSSASRCRSRAAPRDRSTRSSRRTRTSELRTSLRNQSRDVGRRSAALDRGPAAP